MAVCNICGEEFNIEDTLWALMFGHPENVRGSVSVWKAHICQDCEEKIVNDFKLKPKKFKFVEE